MAKATNVIFENWKWSVWETGKGQDWYDITIHDDTQNKNYYGFVELIPEGTELLFGGVQEENEVNLVIQGKPQLPKYLVKVIKDYYQF